MNIPIGETPVQAWDERQVQHALEQIARLRKKETPEEEAAGLAGERRDDLINE